MKMCASIPARAAYAASAPPALPALGTASFIAPRYFAIDTATLIPRALKLCVGFNDSSLIQRSTSNSPPNFCDRISGVPPSPNETGSASNGSGNNSRYRQSDFSRALKLDRLNRSSFRTPARSTIAKSGLAQAVQRFCKRRHSWRSPHALHSRWERNTTGNGAHLSQRRESSGERTSVACWSPHSAETNFENAPHDLEPVEV